jgi:hypothetical protein
MRQVSQLKPERICLAVHRLNFTVYYRRIAAEEYRLLKALREGHSIGRSIQTAFKISSVASSEQGWMLEKWFAAWAELGWLCPRAEVNKERVY